MKQSSGARIINFADWLPVSGRSRYRAFVPYHSSKAAVVALTESLALELAPEILVNAVPTLVRFANASGNPGVHDGVANTRSLAAKFQLPEGRNADILASIEGFPVRTPEEFLAFLWAQLLDLITGQPTPNAVPRFLETHPAARAFVERLMQKPMP